MFNLIHKNFFHFNIINKEIVFTGIQPTGNLHIGNYLGSVKNILRLQNKYQKLYLCIVDYHALTTKFSHNHSTIQYNDNLSNQCFQMAELLIACGIDPKKTCLFIQSHVPQHTELAWILSCIAPQNWLNNMIQYKEKSNKNSCLGLYSYPILMAADILIYKANKVPVGVDQLQHLQLTQKYVDRFNSYFGTYFSKPEYIESRNPKIMSLTDGSKKMSKSDTNDKSRINLSDSQDEIIRKITKAKTDSINQLYFQEQKRPEVTNLMKILAGFSDRSEQQINEEYKSKTIMELKKNLCDVITKDLNNINDNVTKIRKDKNLIRQILRESGEKARSQADKNMKQIKQLMKMYI